MEQEVLHVNDVFLNGDIEWRPLSLTLVEYPKGKLTQNNILLHNKLLYFNILQTIILGDWIGKCLALISLAPFGIGAGFVSLILFRRDLHTVSYFRNFN